MVIPIFVGRDRSIQAIESAMEKNQEILFALQKDAKMNDPRIRTSIAWVRSGPPFSGSSFPTEP